MHTKGSTGTAAGRSEPFQENPEFEDRYNDLIDLASANHPEQVLDALEAYDVSRFSHICDVGGGRDRLLCHILTDAPDLRRTVLELPSAVCEGEQHWASTLGVTERCRYVRGDMFEEVPEADAYLLKWILHNFDDGACQRLLSTVHEAAPPTAACS